MYRFVFLPAFALSTSALLSTTPAIAGPIYESQSGGTFTFYGQFSPAWADFDDGDDSQGKLADNAKSNSRVGFLIVQPFDIYELNFKFETALGFRQTSSISQLDSPDSFDWDREKLRHVDFAFKTPRFGTFYLGQGSMGSDNIGDRNLSQTTVASDVTISDVAASYYLRRDDGSLSDITVASAFNNYEGSRRGRIRYDSPSYMGVTLRTSYGRNILDSDDDDDYWDIALAYDNELSNGTKIAAGLAYAYRDRDDGEDDLKDTFGTM